MCWSAVPPPHESIYIISEPVVGISIAESSCLAPKICLSLSTEDRISSIEMTNYYPITGIPSPDGKPWGDNNKPPIRFECDTWYQNKPIQVSLFIQALQRFYDLKNSNEKSFFNIAGEYENAKLDKVCELTMNRYPWLSSY